MADRASATVAVLGLAVVPAALMAAQGDPPDPVEWARTIGVAALGMAGLAAGPAVRILRWLAARPLRLVVAANVANLADSALTAAVLRSGTAIEANPVIRAVGLPAKVVAVAVAVELVRRSRPHALVVPVAALAAVLAWHGGGLLMG